MKIVEKDQPKRFDVESVKLGDVIKMRCSRGFANYLVVRHNSKYHCVRLDDVANSTPMTLTTGYDSIEELVCCSFKTSLKHGDLVLQKDAELHL